MTPLTNSPTPFSHNILAINKKRTDVLLGMGSGMNFFMLTEPGNLSEKYLTAIPLFKKDQSRPGFEKKPY